MNQKILTSETIQTLRQAYDLSFSDIESQTQIDNSTLRVYASSDKKPSTENAIKLSLIFGVSLDYLLLGTNNQYINNIRLLKLSSEIEKYGFEERSFLEKSISVFTDAIIDEKLSKCDSTDLKFAENYGQNIKTCRKTRNLSQSSIAKQINQSASVISRYESGEYDIGITNLCSFSQLFDVSVHYLCTGNKLSFNFSNPFLKKSVLKADANLNIREQITLCNLMQKLIDNNKIKIPA